MIKSARFDNIQAEIDAFQGGDPELFSSVRNPFDLEAFNNNVGGRRIAGAAIVAFAVAIPTIGGLAKMEGPTRIHEAVYSEGTTPGSTPGTNGEATSTTEVRNGDTTTTSQPSSEFEQFIESLKPYENPVYLADYAPQGSHFFGPEGRKESVEASRSEFVDTRISLDPALLVSSRETIGLETYDSPEARDEAVKKLDADPELWKKQADEFRTIINEGKNPRFETIKGTYATKYMVPKQGDGERPYIYQLPERSDNGKMLLVMDITTPDGKEMTVEWKIDCGYQPVSEHKFPGVPTTPPKTPETPTTPPSTPNTSFPPTTPPTEETTTTTKVGPKEAKTPVTGGSPTTVEVPHPGPSNPTTSTTEKAPTTTQTTITAPNPSSTTVPAGPIGTNRPGGRNR